jgi:hypothetical protein
MAQQVKSIQSESLESSYRALTPSQDGFTQDLMASNTIIPVIDLTSSASASGTPDYLQRAYSTATGIVSVNGTTPVNIVTNTGFWQIQLNLAADTSAGSPLEMAAVEIFDGSTSYDVWRVSRGVAGGDTNFITGNFVVFINSGNSLRGTTHASNEMDVTYSQIADINGVLVNPQGFTPQ